MNAWSANYDAEEMLAAGGIDPDLKNQIMGLVRLTEGLATQVQNLERLICWQNLCLLKSFLIFLFVDEWIEQWIPR